MTVSLHYVDYIIFIVVIVISFCIGVYHAYKGRNKNSPGEYLTGNRQMSILPITLSLVFSFLSGITVLGTPAEMYTRGTQLYMRTFGYCLACFISSIFIVPLFYILKCTSSFEYLEKRFDSKVTKLLGTISMLAGSVFYMGLLLYTPASAISTSTQLPLYASILAVSLTTTVYTSLGGLRGVVWTDVFQALVMVSGMVLIVVKGVMLVGGVEEVWRISQEGYRIKFFDFDPDPTIRLSFWSTVIGGFFSSLTHFGVGQVSVQRYCSLPSMKKAQRSVLFNIPCLIIMNTLTSAAGLVIYAFYASIQCDPLKNKDIKSPNQLVPYFIINQLNYPGVPGVFLAVLLSGAFSSMSSTLNSCAAVTWQDLLSTPVEKIMVRRKTKALQKKIQNGSVLVNGKMKTFEKDGGTTNSIESISKMASYDGDQEADNKMTENTKARILRILVLLYGVLALGMAFATQMLGQHVLQASLSFTGATMGPALGMFLLGGLFPFANYKGVITGSVISSVFCLWLSMGAFVTKPHRQKLPTSIIGCHNNNHSFLSTTHSITTTLFTNTNTSAFVEPYSGFDKFYEISFLWYSAIGCVMTIVIGVVVSLITRSKWDKRPANSLLIHWNLTMFRCRAEEPLLEDKM